MSDAALGLSMLGLIVVVIMLGFPTAFTLMGLGMFFGFIAFYDPSQHWFDNRVFDLMVQRAFGAMTNETLLSIPLFVLMGYVMERGALVDRMFHSVRLAFRSVPGSLAVATLIICTFWGIASGLVGAVVVLMGVIAMRPMLNAGYDIRLASGVITAGGTLGILIPPSVMIIVYAAVAGQSVVKLYAAAMIPGFFLAFLYLLYVIGWAVLKPSVAPRLPPEQERAPITPWVGHVSGQYGSRMLPALLAAVAAPRRALAITAEGVRATWPRLLGLLGMALVPIALAAVTLGLTWWYVVIHSQEGAAPAASAEVSRKTAATPPVMPPSASAAAVEAAGVQEPSTGLQEPPSAGVEEPPSSGGLAEPPGAAGVLLTISVVAAISSGIVIGIFTGRSPHRRSRLVLAIIMSNVVAWTVVLALPGQAPLWLLVVLIVVISVGGPGSMVGFDFARTFNPSATLGTAQGMVNMGGFVGSLVVMQAMGVILDAAGDFSAESFRLAWTVQYAIWILAVVGILITRRKARRLMRVEQERMLLEGFKAAPTTR